MYWLELWAKIQIIGAIIGCVIWLIYVIFLIWVGRDK